MSSILGPIQKLAQVLTGLTSDAGDVIQRQFTETPEQPQAGDFPILIIEVDPEHENQFQRHSLGGAHNVYKLNLMILVGNPSTTPISQLHNMACAWVYPLGVKLCSNMGLSRVDDVLDMGYGGIDQGTEDFFLWRVQGIVWNQQTFYGLRVSLPIKEDLTIAMA